MSYSDEELRNVRSFHAVTAWIFALGIGVASCGVVVMSGLRF